MNTITEAHIDSLLANSEIDGQIFWNKETVVSIKLPCGFSIMGRSACVDPANFDYAIGKQLAIKDAKNKLWELEGYLLQNTLYAAGKL